jgi:hypothetical protein
MQPNIQRGSYCILAPSSSAWATAAVIAAAVDITDATPHALRVVLFMSDAHLADNRCTSKAIRRQE